MFIRKLALALVFASVIAGPLCAGDGDHDRPYSLASINGEFALVGSYTGGLTAARQLGVVHINNGDVTGYLRVNVQGSTPTQRVVIYLSFTGSTTIAEDGTGVVTLSVTYPDQSLHQATLDFLITKALETRDAKIAIELAEMQRETPALSPGSFIVGTLTRRPE